MKKNDDSTKPFLKSVHIQNFKSLHDVSLELKPITIIVGPNSSGKSNCLEALRFLKILLSVSELPPKSYIRDQLWVGHDTKDIKFELSLSHDDAISQYLLSLSSAQRVKTIQKEQFRVNDVNVIDVVKGKGKVKNEDGSQPVPYTSEYLALKSAGSYGVKPITGITSDFIQSWQFYDVDPAAIRAEYNPGYLVRDQLDPLGGALYKNLATWSSENPYILDSINDGIKSCRSLDMVIERDKRRHLKINEGLTKLLPLSAASDGTLRLLFYLTLVHQPELPTLIGLEEPERNLHPAILTQVSSLLEELSAKTQVVITTHSSQLLDCFSPDKLKDGSLSVILLKKKAGLGTQAVSLSEISNDKEALNGWMSDFGIGNAVFHSQLLQDIMG